MSAVDVTVGYPVHAVETYAQRNNGHGVTLTDWRATCGAVGQAIGARPFGVSGSARWRELCARCFPARHATPHRAPVKVEATQ